MSSTNFVSTGLYISSKTKIAPPLGRSDKKSWTLYSGVRYVALWVPCFVKAFYRFSRSSKFTSYFWRRVRKYAGQSIVRMVILVFGPKKKKTDSRHNILFRLRGYILQCSEQSTTTRRLGMTSQHDTRLGDRFALSRLYVQCSPMWCIKSCKVSNVQRTKRSQTWQTSIPRKQTNQEAQHCLILAATMRRNIVYFPGSCRRPVGQIPTPRDLCISWSVNKNR